MKRIIIFIFGFFIQISLISYVSFAQVTNFLDNSTATCPKAIIIRPEISGKNVFISGDNTQFFLSASYKIGSSLSDKLEGSAVISQDEFKKMNKCKTPIILTKLKSYSLSACSFGACTGDIAISLLIFNTPTSEKPDNIIDISAKGKFPEWGELAPFQAAIAALCETIKTNELLEHILK